MVEAGVYSIYFKVTADNLHGSVTCIAAEMEMEEYVVAIFFCVFGVF